MSIIDVITKACTQTAVYWAVTGSDGFKNTYAAPVEIACRWEGKAQLVKGWDAKGNIIDYIGIVYILQDVDEEGCLFLGTLNDLDSGADVDPLSMEGVYRIKQFEKLPILYSTTEFSRRAFLTQWQYR